MRALWIEDHQLIGESLEMLLNVVMPDISLDKAVDWEAGCRLLEAFSYDLVLMDWWLGKSDAEEAMAWLRAHCGAVPVIVVSGDDRPELMQRASALGAVGFVNKAADPAALVAEIRKGLASNSRDASEEPGPGVTPPALRPLPNADVDLEARFPALTARQADVYRLLVQGRPDKQIARELDISDTTVKTHVRAILQIVGVRTRGEAAYAALSRGPSGR